MLPDIKSIKMRRKILGITQKDLARHTETSQSFIAKLESGRINPSYRHMKKILDFIESLEIKESEELRAKEVYRKSVLSVSVSDKIPAVVRLMKRHGISQLPVFRNSLSCSANRIWVTASGACMRMWRDQVELGRSRANRPADVGNQAACIAKTGEPGMACGL